MSVVTLRPSADGTTTGWTVTGGTGSHASAIVDDPDAHDGDTSYVLSPNVLDGTMFVELDDVPADFDPDAINSITLKVAHRRLNTPKMAVDSGTVNAFLTRADELTAISTTPIPVVSPIQAGYLLSSFAPIPTGTHTVAEWNGARLALVFDHTAAQTEDSVNQVRITAAEVVIDYTPASTQVAGTATLSGVAAVVALAVGLVAGSATLNASSSVVATGSLAGGVVEGSAVVQGTSSITASPIGLVSGNAVLQGTSSVIAASIGLLTGNAVVTGLATLQLSATALVTASVDIQGVANLTATGEINDTTVSGVATLLAGSTLTADPTLLISGSGVVQGVATVTATASLVGGGGSPTRLPTAVLVLLLRRRN